MNLTKIISLVLFLASIALAIYLYTDIKATIDVRDSIASTEAQIKDKLEIIREAQKVFLEQYGHYTENWDSLITFIQTGRVPVVVRKETIIPLSYGVDSIHVTFDTLGYTTAEDKIFKKTYSINAADNGTFLGFYVKTGDEVVKGAKSYRLRKEGNDRIDEYTFLEGGTISSLADVQSGDQVRKGQNLITFWNYQHNPNVDVATLHKLPGSDEEFDITVGKVDRNGVLVSTIHVIDPAPVNPNRSKDNEAKNRQPLQFGSKTDVGTGGNWE